MKEKRGPGRPKTIKDMRAYKTQKQRVYRLRDKLNPSQATKINGCLAPILGVPE